MTGALLPPGLVVAALPLVLVSAATAEAPNLVAPKPGEVVAAGGVRVRVLPTTELTPDRCCVLQFQRPDGSAWTAAAAFGAETTVAGVAEATGVSFRSEAFMAAPRWRVRARFTQDTDWTEWREFAVTQAPQ